jgi:hypothetical protein
MSPTGETPTGRGQGGKSKRGGGIFGSSDGAAVMGVGGRRDGAWERAVVHSAAATWGAHSTRGSTSTSHTLLPPLSRESADISSTADTMRVHARYCASRGGQCASRVLLGGLGGQQLTDWWEVGYITRMCPFRHCSRHISTYQANFFFFNPLINALCS